MLTLLRKSIFISLFAFGFSSSLFSQSFTGNIKGRLVDSAGKKPLSLATITVFKALDTALITYRLSDEDGNFKIPFLPLDVTCRVLISFSGYRVYRKEFELNKQNSQLDFGVITLGNSAQLLDEVFVQAERPPVSIRKDTIEFNASAFKSLPSALLEDLLKKLPGIDIDTDGKIMVKGKQVNRLLVDGKEFFGGDPKIATKNLPANMVDKVQVMDDKEQIDKNPDISPADVGQIINIKLKKAIKQGWFGKAYAGVGTNSRNETGAIINVFRDTTQISVLGYSNNINKSGFGITDLQKIGGFDRSGVNSMGVYSDGGISLNGSSFGGTGQGIQLSSGGGFNFNHQFKKKVTLNLQYFYGQVNSNFESVTNRQRFLSDTIQVVRSKGLNKNENNNHRIGATLTWKIDSLTTLTFRPGLTLLKNTGDRNSSTFISDNFKGSLNDEDNRQRINGNGNMYNHNLFINKLFKKKGRVLTINNNVSVNENLNDQYYDLVNTFYINPATIVSNQLRQRETGDLNSSLNISWSEPLSKTASLRVAHNAEFIKENNSLKPFNRNNNSGKYLDIIDSLNTALERNLWRNTTTAGITWRKKKLNINASFNVQALSYRNTYLKAPKVVSSFTFVYPSVSIDYNGMRLSYSENIRPPSPYDLQPVPDNTNRQFIQFGNPDLQPVYSRNLSFNIYKFKPNGSSFSFYLNGSATNNSVMRLTTVDKQGIQTSKPVNVSGLKNGYVNLSYTRQFKFSSNWKLSLRPTVGGGYNESVLSFNGNTSDANSVNLYNSLNAGFNYKDVIELNQRYSLSLNKSWYSNKGYYKNLRTITHSAESEIIVRLPKHFVWETTINYTYNPQVAAGIKKSFVRWNGAINYLFLKEDKGQLKLSVFDLLNQNISVFRYTTENSIFDSQTSTLQRYFMLSFIYNIRTFKPAKVGGKDKSFFLF